MRKEAKETKNISIARVQGYHEGGYSCRNREQYAYMGYAENKYFTSDRFIRLDENYNRADGRPMKGFGLEIETECNGITNETVLAEVMEKIIFSHFPDHLFKMQHDGSLGGRTSAECITQPMTKEFIRNNYKNFKAMYDTYFPAFNISCSESGNCGMHVNISTGVFGTTEKSQADAIRKLYYIVNRHFDFCCALFNRSSQQTTYCSRMDYSNACTMELAGFYSDHHCSFNLGHYTSGRIEIRLVGGQKDFPCFRNTMECIFHLVERVKAISWNDIDDITKIFEKCNYYVFDRIRSYCYHAGTVTVEQVNKIRETCTMERNYI